MYVISAHTPEMVEVSEAAAALKMLRKRARVSVRATAKAIGRPTSSYSSYEDTYKKPYLPVDLVRALIPLFCPKGIEKSELLALAGLTENLTPSRPVAMKPVPRESLDFAGEAYSAVPAYDIRAAAGAGAMNGEHEEPDSFVLYRTQWLERITRASLSALAVIRVAGDSMWETLHDGDQVLVDRSIRGVGRDGLYVIRLGDELQVKRVSRHPTTKLLTIKSDNPAYPTHTEVDPDSLDVAGRVVWLGRNVG